MKENKTNISWEEKFQQEEEKYKKQMQKPNILLVGRTGAGKSSIVNMIFGEDTVDVGIGKPITKGFNKVSHNDKNVIIYDSEGYEINKDEGLGFISNTIKFITEKSNFDKEKIHLIWLVIPANSSRVPDFEIELYKELINTKVPVALIFSQCDESNEDELNPMIERFFPNMTFEKAALSEENPFFVTTDREVIAKQGAYFSLEKLINWSISQLPQIFENAFISAQNISLKAKLDKANRIVLEHTTSNAIIGFTPIPFSDAPILLASQATMLTRIFSLFDISTNNVNTFIKNTGAGLVISSLGKSIVGQLLKLIPGIGTVIGGTINATVAAGITYAMGKTSAQLIYSFLDAKINNKIQIDTDFMNYFTSNFNDIFEQFFSEKMKSHTK